LDTLEDVCFTQNLINEIVLWKVNRYVSLSTEHFQEIEKIKLIETGQHRKARPVLETLLHVHGVDLPMASTFLRFRNPKAFQIIDRHAYRAIFGESYRLNVLSGLEKKISTYFEYLDRLLELCILRKLNFETIDRLLYIFDKRVNGKLKEKGST
jgi:thermostable 8-oxoguanine DNA glycosylase